MTGFEALLIVAVAIWIADAASGGVITRAASGAATHAAAQGRSEMRRVKEAVVENSKASLRQRIEDGKAAGPKSAWWWGVAAVSAGGKVRRALKGLRDGASGEHARSLPSAGPLRRVWDAAVAGGLLGARKAREEARARREARPSWRERAAQAGRNATGWARNWRREDGGVRMDVCDDCGVLAAATALERSGRMLRCASCRAVPGVTGIPAVDAGAGGGGDGADIVDAELVPEPAVIPPPIPPALPYASDTDTNGAGELMAGTGQIVRRTAGTPAATGGGDLSTHGDYDRYSELIAGAVDVTTRCQEAMLGNLRAADAGRTQMADIRAWSDRASVTAMFIRAMVAGVDQRILPLIDVINAKGGTHEIAKPGYYAQV